MGEIVQIENGIQPERKICLFR